MRVAITLQIPTEAKLCLYPPTTQPIAGSINTEVLPALHAQGRTVDVMLPDGNCLFRAISKGLFGVQSGHLTLREIIVTFIQSNEKVFGGVCNGTVQTHCERMRKTGAFGTQAELQATASLFQVPVYVFHKPGREGRNWEWMRYQPYSKEHLSHSATRLNIPEAPDSVRLEILYSRTGAHFDLIVPQSEKSAVSPPVLPGLLHEEQATHILH